MIENEIVYKMKLNKRKKCSEKRLFVPDVLKNSVMEIAHDSKMGGHLGIKNTRIGIKK